MQKLNKNEPQVVFVACDGISTGLYCLKQLGVNVNKYISSENDAHPIAVSAYNHPNDNIIRVGDLNKVTLEDIKDVTLFLASTPCQNLSSINKNKLGIYGDGSNLFFKAVDLLKELNTYRASIGLDDVPFLFENVGSASMTDVTIMSNALGVDAMRINSSKLSGALRNRLYWFNWDADQPEDKGILLKDVLESGYALKDKANALLTRQPSMTDNGLERVLNKSVGNLVITNKVFAELPRDKMVDEFNKITNNGEHKDKIPFRKLTINEMEALMTLQSGYVNDAPISDTQKIKCIGNGWTADVIIYLLNEVLD